MSICLLTGCSAGFLGLAPAGDRKEYVQARDAYDAAHYQEAISQLRDYIYKTKNVSRREARAYRLLGSSYEKLGNPSQALETYLEALEFHPKNVPLLVETGRLYQQNGLTARSIEMYERALTLAPENVEALSGQAANYANLGFFSKARSLYEQLFALADNISAQDQARYASTFLRQREYAQAFIHITQALAQEKTNPDFWLLTAQARRGLHQPALALDDLQMAISLAPQRTDLLAHKALWLYDMGEYQASLQTTQDLLKQSPQNTLAQLIQALNWLKQGKKKAAQKQLAQIAQTTPTSFVGQVAAKLATDSFTSPK